MEAFFADVATVKSILGDVRKKLVKLNKLNDESKTATRTETMKRYRDEMNGVIEEVSTTARECKLRLENLDRANEEAAKGAGVFSTVTMMAPDGSSPMEQILWPQVI